MKQVLFDSVEYWESYVNFGYTHFFHSNLEFMYILLRQRVVGWIFKVKLFLPNQIFHLSLFG